MTGPRRRPRPRRLALTASVAVTVHTLNRQFGYLRRKLEAGGASRLVHTVYGVGYVLDER